MKFHFKGIDVDGSTFRFEMECDTWCEAVEKFPQFLRGCGFFVEDKHISYETPFGWKWEYDDTQVDEGDDYSDDPKKEEKENELDNNPDKG